MVSQSINQCSYVADSRNELELICLHWRCKNHLEATHRLGLQAVHRLYVYQPTFSDDCDAVAEALDLRQDVG